MNRPLIALAGLVVAGGTIAGGGLIASPGGEEEVVQQVETATPDLSSTPGASIPAQSPSPEATPAACDPNPTAPAGAKVWRWGDVTVIIPEDSGVRAVGDFGAEAKPFLAISPEEDIDARTVVDARTGAVLADHSQGDKEPAIQAVVATISVCPLDTGTAPWPYTGEPPEAGRMTFGKLGYLEPDPASGIQVMGRTYCGVSSTGTEGCRYSLAARSARSSLYIDTETGKTIEPSKIASEDQEAFGRFFAAVSIEAQ